MKIGDYITVADWNALGRDKQLALRDGLRFVGYRVSDDWLPKASINGPAIIVLDNGSDLITLTGSCSTGYIKFEMDQILAFIDLTSFQVTR